jgi:hypothetical protein
MPRWFGKEKSKAETSPGGSVIHRYPIEQWQPSRAGFADESTAAFAEKRNEVYGRLFGKVNDVSMEALPLVPRIDVHIYFRTGANGSRVCTLATAGMSDRAMNIPARANVPRRVELIFYCSEPLPEYVETLRWLAHFPHDQKTWIGSGHTIPNGNPPVPFWGSSILDTFLLIPSLVQRDRTLREELVLEGDPVHFLWVVPLTASECKLKLDRGTNAILDLFDKHKHPHVFDPNRVSYV